MSSRGTCCSQLCVFSLSTDDKLVHLDPHYCQVATEPPEDTHTYRDIDIKVPRPLELIGGWHKLIVTRIGQFKNPAQAGGGGGGGGFVYKPMEVEGRKALAPGRKVDEFLVSTEVYASSREKHVMMTTVWVRCTMANAFPASPL